MNHLINKITKGDAFKVLDEIDDASIDLIMGDLPFGVTDNEWDWNIVPHLPELWAKYKRVLKPNGIVLMFGTNPFDKQLWASNPKSHRYDLIWVKNIISNPYQIKQKPLSLFETIGYYRFSDSKGTYNPQLKQKNVVEKIKNRTEVRVGRNLKYSKPQTPYIDTGARYPENVIYCEHDIEELQLLYFEHDEERFDSTKKQTHRNPTQKPITLYEYLIKTYSNEGDMVLDTFAGTATTAVACINTDRNFICVELDSENDNKIAEIETEILASKKDTQKTPQAIEEEVVKLEKKLEHQKKCSQILNGNLRIDKALKERKQLGLLDSQKQIQQRKQLITERLLSLKDSQKTLI